MLNTLLFFALAIHGNAQDGTNPYSSYGGRESTQGYGYPGFQSDLIRGCGDANWDSDCQCEAQKKKIDWVKRQGRKLDEFNWKDIQSKQLVIIGDAHGVSSPDAIVNLIKRSQPQSSRQCVFFEMSSEFSGQQFLHLLREKTGDEETDKLRRYYLKIANGAVSMGKQLFMVDSPKNWNGDRKVSDFEREMHMSQLIQRAFSSGQCTQAVFVVGKDHANTLSERLSKAGISLTRLNPIHSSNGGRNGPTEEWNGICMSQTFTPSHALIFPNFGIKNDLIYPGFFPPNSTMRYEGFDYSILLPEPRFEQDPVSATKTRSNERTTGTR